MFETMINKLKESPKKKMVFTEGFDPRIIEVAGKLVSDNIMIPVLVGKEATIRANAEELGVSLEGMEVIDPATYPDMDEMVARMFEIRNGKMTEQQCQQSCTLGNYFGTMLVKMGKADGLLGGATYTTADTVRPALQIIKTKPNCKLVSSAFILHRCTEKGKETYVMGDCAINTYPTSEELVDITMETAQTARAFGIEPVVALLSYGTCGSAKGDSVSTVRAASLELKSMNLDYLVDGELQFDAAFSPEVAALKASHSKVAGHANTFIFPNIDAGNIGYKMAQRLGGFEAFGPILQGLNSPINDLSRGCNMEEVYKMAVITASQAN